MAIRRKKGESYESFSNRKTFAQRVKLPYPAASAGVVSDYIEAGDIACAIQYLLHQLVSADGNTIEARQAAIASTIKSAINARWSIKDRERLVKVLDAADAAPTMNDPVTPEEDEETSDERHAEANGS